MLFKNNQDGKIFIKNNVSHAKLFSFLNASFPYLPMNHGCDLKKKKMALCWCWVSDHSGAQTLMSPCPKLSQQLAFWKTQDPFVPQQPWDPDSGQAGSTAALPISSLPCRESQGEDQLMQAEMWRMHPLRKKKIPPCCPGRGHCWAIRCQ